jgi:hypothetical protein
MIRAAQEIDLEQVLDLAEAKRRQYAGYQPTFHRPARNARDVHRLYLSAQIEDPETIVLVDDENGTINRFLIAKTGYCQVEIMQGAMRRWMATPMKMVPDSDAADYEDRCRGNLGYVPKCCCQTRPLVEREGIQEGIDQQGLYPTNKKRWAVNSVDP